jgi:hypothetical protein
MCSNSGRARSFPLLQDLQIDSQTHTASYSTGNCFLMRVNPLVHEFVHAAPSNVEVKNEWTYNSSRSIHLRGVKTEEFFIFNE